jgi:hypothetical protein
VESGDQILWDCAYWSKKGRKLEMKEGVGMKVSNSMFWPVVA